MKKGKKFLSNRLAYTLIAIGILLVVAIGVYAVGAVPNPGHPISQLQTCDSNGQTLIMSNGAWTCGSASSLAKGQQLFIAGPVCTNPGSLTTTSSCSTAICNSGGNAYYCCIDAGTLCGNYCAYYWTYYYDCNGGCASDLAHDKSQACPNSAVGYLVQ